MPCPYIMGAGRPLAKTRCRGRMGDPALGSGQRSGERRGPPRAALGSADTTGGAAMKKPEQKAKGARKAVKVKDLTPRDTAKVKGGFNPQPEPPGYRPPIK